MPRLKLSDVSDIGGLLLTFSSAFTSDKHEVSVILTGMSDVSFRLSVTGKSDVFVRLLSDVNVILTLDV